MFDIPFLVVKQNLADQKMMSKDRNLKWHDEANKPSLQARPTEENNKWEMTLKMRQIFSQHKSTQLRSGQKTYTDLH